MQFHQDDQLEEEKRLDADVIDRKRQLNDDALPISGRRSLVFPAELTALLCEWAVVLISCRPSGVLC
jgi:hypothetical protein